MGVGEGSGRGGEWRGWGGLRRGGAVAFSANTKSVSRSPSVVTPYLRHRGRLPISQGAAPGLGCGPGGSHAVQLAGVKHHSRQRGAVEAAAFGRHHRHGGQLRAAPVRRLSPPARPRSAEGHKTGGSKAGSRLSVRADLQRSDRLVRDEQRRAGGAAGAAEGEHAAVERDGGHHFALVTQQPRLGRVGLRVVRRRQWDGGGGGWGRGAAKGWKGAAPGQRRWRRR